MKQHLGDEPKYLLCPSAQPDMKNSRLLGVVGGSAKDPRIAYLEESQPVTNEILAMAGPLKPTEIFRFAAECETSACAHFNGTSCQLATRLVQLLPAVAESLPACRIRADCRWYLQEGRPACLRCPQVLTEDYTASDLMVRAATPA